MGQTARTLFISLAIAACCLLAGAAALPVAHAWADETTTHVTSTDDAYAYLRDQMAQRKATITFTYPAANFVLDENTLYAETGSGQQGDYLRLGVDRLETQNGFRSGSAFGYTFGVTYYTTAEQEQTLDQELDDVASALQLGSANLTQTQKVFAIYDWICRNVSYLPGNEADERDAAGNYLHYTAYGALHNRQAVCQGFASLFYRLARMAGLDARCVAGVSSAGTDPSVDDHMWNIVRIGETWYNLDATWDSAAADGKYEWFLKNDDDFKGTADNGHITADYAYNGIALDDTQRAADSFVRIAAQEPTCTRTGIAAHYECGADYFDEALTPTTLEAVTVAALGHDEGVWNVTKPASATVAGEKQLTCTRCGTVIETAEIPATSGDGQSSSGTGEGGSSAGDGTGSGSGNAGGTTSGSGGAAGEGSGDTGTGSGTGTNTNTGANGGSNAGTGTTGAGTGAGTGATAGTGAGTNTVSKVPAAAKVANTLKAKAKSKKLKVSYNKRKATKVSAKKAFKVSKAIGAVTYSKAKGCSSKIKVSRKGIITIPKKTKRGKYKVKVNVTANGDKTHNAASIPVSFVIQVK